MRNVQMFSTLILIGSMATACGNNAGQSPVAQSSAKQALGDDSDVITDAGFAAVVAQKEFDDRSKAPECLALRAEINVLRPALLAKAEWISLVKTDAWQKLTTDYDSYVTGNCPSVTLPATEISESCAAARTQVIQNWATVQASSEYEVVQKHDALATLTQKWNNAVTTGCISH